MAAAADLPAHPGDKGGATGEKSSERSESIGEITHGQDQLQRHLGNRQIQLIAIGGTIGTGLFVSIGSGLATGGPANLLLAYSLHALMVCLINNSLAEMTCYMPVSGSFIRMAGKWVDEALGFLAGWNFFLYEAILIPFEITALNLVLTYWTDKIPVAAICIAVIILYAIINILAVQYYGEAEFWLSLGKLILLLIVFFFTFITAVGGNPQHDAYGFRYWYSPGAFAETISTGALGRFQGFLGSLFSASFTVVGPEYIAMVAGEAERPRVYIKNGFKTVYWRFFVFFVLGSLACGVIIPYDDPKLNSGTGSADGSPYVIAMQNMGVAVLPHIVNALLLTSIFSAGNAYVYCAMRSLHGLACEGQAPRIFKKTLKNGIPIYAFAVTMAFPFLSFLQAGSSTGSAVATLQSVTQGATMINYICISLTYIFFYRACKAQGVDRSTLPYKGWFQPYGAYITFVYMIILEGISGYVVFIPGHWSVAAFFPPYTMAFVTILLFFGYKIFKRTHYIKPHEADLIWEKPQIDEYEATFTEPPTRFRDDIRAMFSGKKMARQDHIGDTMS
ncbi:histidine permease [Xylaria bambusicola]|uniref:histidine permease n=1 Tax=Xylaria bambusicola TaxID=326684 RepID=UPI0020086762|nr:histidine permease [Xylaria bambusicola]KAI0517881.1 histidine permease [Xylaria bambusicola]